MMKEIKLDETLFKEIKKTEPNITKEEIKRVLKDGSDLIIERHGLFNIIIYGFFE